MGDKLREEVKFFASVSVDHRRSQVGSDKVVLCELLLGFELGLPVAISLFSSCAGRGYVDDSGDTGCFAGSNEVSAPSDIDLTIQSGIGGVCNRRKVDHGLTTCDESLEAGDVTEVTHLQLDSRSVDCLCSFDLPNERANRISPLDERSNESFADKAGTARYGDESLKH
jgi:hypothetical protein